MCFSTRLTGPSLGRSPCSRTLTGGRACSLSSYYCARAFVKSRGASNEMRLRANPESSRDSKLRLNFETHSAITTRQFAGAMGDGEVEVTSCRSRTEDTHR